MAYTAGMDERPEPGVPGAEAVLPLEDSIDLHAFSPEEVGAVVAEYLEACRRAGIGDVRLIHGRGIGVQKGEIVRELLQRSPGVLSFGRRAGLNGAAGG